MCTQDDLKEGEEQEVLIMSVASCRYQVHVSWELFIKRIGKKQLNLGNSTINIYNEQEEIIGSLNALLSLTELAKVQSLYYLILRFADHAGYPSK